MNSCMVRDGYVWHAIPDPVALRLIPSDGFHAALDVLEEREVSSVRLASVLTMDCRAVVAHDIETDRWWRRVRKSRAKVL